MENYKVTFNVYIETDDKENAESLAYNQIMQGDSPMFADKIVKVVKTGRERKRYMTKKQIDKVVKESKEYLESRKKRDVLSENSEDSKCHK